MREIRVVSLTVELIGSFFASSRDALERARDAKSSQVVKFPDAPGGVEPTGLNIFVHRRAETQASLECIVFSFLVLEACINYFFFVEQRGGSNTGGFTAWLRQKWQRGGLSISDRFLLLVDRYTTALQEPQGRKAYSAQPRRNFEHLSSLFSEFITFRNRIVHAYPEEYHALVEEESAADYFFVHDVMPVSPSTGRFSVSGLSREIGRICLEDASRSFEIMLLIFSFLDEEYVANFKLPWLSKNASREDSWEPRRILESLGEAQELCGHSEQIRLA
jgi:hypothetical protein